MLRAVTVFRNSPTTVLVVSLITELRLTITVTQPVNPVIDRQGIGAMSATWLIAQKTSRLYEWQGLTSIIDFASVSTGVWPEGIPASLGFHGTWQMVVLHYESETINKKPIIMNKTNSILTPVDHMLSSTYYIQCKSPWLPV